MSRARFASLALLLAPPAWGEAPPEPASSDEKRPLSVSFSDDLEIRYWISPQRVPGFPDRPVFNYIEQVNRLNLTIGRGPWSALLQVDQVLLAANRYRLDGDLRWERQLLSPEVFWPIGFGDWYVNPEKVGFRWQQGDLALKLGDFYAAFGTGIALNLNRNVDIDIDTSIQGAYALYRTGAWDLQGLVGMANRQQVSQDNPNLDVYGDLRHLIAGARVERYGIGPANLGLHGVVIGFAEDVGWGPGVENFAATPDVVIGGATVELVGVLGVDWTLEGDVFAFPTAVAWGGADPRPGHALYGAAVFYVGRTTWQLEGRRSKDAQRVNAPTSRELYQITAGPTLEYERAITEDSGAAIGSNDITGGRLRMDWTAVQGQTIPYASVAVFRDLDVGELHFNAVPETIVHPLIGVETFGSDLTVLFNAGFRMDVRDGAPLGDGDRQLHGDVDVKVPLGKDFHLDVVTSAEWYQWGRNPLQQTDYAEVESSISVMYGSKLALTWFTDYSSNPLIDTEGNLSDTVYGAVELQYKPLPALTLKAFGGAYKSGIRCSGGQCRVLPGFEGLRVSATGTF